MRSETLESLFSGSDDGTFRRFSQLQVDDVFDVYDRICPGLHLADAALFVTCVMVLSVFSVSKAVDEHGHVVEPLIEYTSGTITYAHPSTLLLHLS